MLLCVLEAAQWFPCFVLIVSYSQSWGPAVVIEALLRILEAAA